MTVFVKKYQNTNAKMVKQYRKWYSRAVVVDEVEIEELATEIQDSCTVKRSDILAVLSELGPAIKKMVQKSMKVRLPYLGTFKLTVASTGAEEEDEYDVRKHVKAVKVNFRPDYKIEQGHVVRELTRGARVAEVPKNLSYLPDEDDDEEENNGGGNNNGGNGGGAINDEP